MTLETMITEARQIIGQPDENGSNFTDSQMTTWVNEFYRRVCVMLETLPIKERLYDAGDTGTLNSRMVTVDRVKFYEQTATEWRELKIKDMDELYVLDPDWENAATGVPSYLIRTGTFTYRLYPPLNSANTGKTNNLKTHGLELPADLTADADVPDLPLNIQDLFPYWVAFRCFTRLAEKERAAEMYAMVQAGLKDQKQISTKFSDSRGWRWAVSGHIDPEGIFQ